MDNLDKALKSLSKIEPENGFIKASKQRLMHQINTDAQEVWLKSFLKKLDTAKPSESFIQAARRRLMHRINVIPQPVKVPLRRLVYSFSFLKKATASALVMLIAVTSTLFVVEGSTIVEASDDSYLEVLYGEVSVKHADLIVWEKVNDQIELQAGDLVKVKSGSQAVVHFFDDSQLRINENSMLLISDLRFSPAYDRQGMIEVSLHEGEAWVQTMNIEDGHAGFVVTTRNAVAKALNASFNVTASPRTPTEVSTYKGKVSVNNQKLAANQKVVIRGELDPSMRNSELAQDDRATEWIQGNLFRDREHLKNLRENGYDRLNLVAGTLPGDMLYPIKQAKERLKLVWSDNNEDLAVKIEIANNRLNEAIVLLQRGETEKGQAALKAYQELAREIMQASESVDLASKLITPHQKALSADLTPVSGLVKEALSETAEILADSPLDLERVRIANSVARLQDILVLLEEGDLSTASERLSSHRSSVESVAFDLSSFSEEELTFFQSIVELQQEEHQLLLAVVSLLEDFESNEEALIAMVESASEASEDKIKEALEVAVPFIPELAPEPIDTRTPEQKKFDELIAKIKIYGSFEGQKNQIARLLADELENPDSLNYVIAVRNQLDGRTYDWLNNKILLLKRQLKD